MERRSPPDARPRWSALGFRLASNASFDSERGLSPGGTVLARGGSRSSCSTLSRDASRCGVALRPLGGSELGGRELPDFRGGGWLRRRLEKSLGREPIMFVRCVRRVIIIRRISSGAQIFGRFWSVRIAPGRFVSNGNARRRQLRSLCPPTTPAGYRARGARLDGPERANSEESGAGSPVPARTTRRRAFPGCRATQLLAGRGGSARRHSLTRAAQPAGYTAGLSFRRVTGRACPRRSSRSGCRSPHYSTR
ncbi:MAG: hypothetical protein RL685_2935 [Pseudomonadota bacterium]|jgi:hypothetical protein